MGSEMCIRDSIIRAFTRENMPVLTIGNGVQILDLIDLGTPTIDDATGVGADGPIVVATAASVDAGLKALNEAMLGSGESVAA